MLTVSSLATTTISCIVSNHGQSRMTERDITISNVQRTKKYGLIEKLLFDREPLLASVWRERLMECEYVQHAQPAVLNATTQRQEIKITHVPNMAYRIKTWLDRHGFFEERGNKIVFSDPDTGTSVVEGRLSSSAPIRVVTAYIRQPGQSTQVYDVDNDKGRAFLREVEEADLDSYVLDEGLRLTSDQIDNICKYSGAAVDLRGSSCVIKGSPPARRAALGRLQEEARLLACRAAARDGRSTTGRSG